MCLNFFKTLFKKNDIYSQKKDEIVLEIEKTEAKCRALKLKYSKKITDLEKSELIIDYMYSLDSRHLLYSDFYEWNKQLGFKQRSWFVIEHCTNTKSQRELFLLSLAYHRLGVKYTNYCIYYMKLFLDNKCGFDKEMPKCNNITENHNYQISMINYLISVNYKDNLEFDKALRHAFASKGMNEKVPRKFNPYSNISEILYKKGDLNNAIQNAREGLRNTTDPYEKKALQELLEKYEQYKREGKMYTPMNKQRPRYDIKTGLLYDLTTGEIIE